MLVWLYFPIHPLFLTIPSNILRFILSSTYIFIFIISFLISPIVALSIPLPLLPLARLSTFVLSSLFASPLTVLFVPRVQELTLASLTRPLLGALRAAIGIKYSFISFITFILIGLSLNKSLIEPYY